MVENKTTFAGHPLDRLVNDVKAAEALGLSASWMRQQRIKGLGPKFVKLGRTVRYRVSDLAEYVDSSRVGGRDATV